MKNSPLSDSPWQLSKHLGTSETFTVWLWHTPPYLSDYPPAPLAEDLSNHPDSHRRFRRVLRIALVCKALAPSLNEQDQEIIEKQLAKVGEISAPQLKSGQGDDRELNEHYQALGQLDDACSKLFGPEYTREDILSLPIFDQR